MTKEQFYNIQFSRNTKVTNGKYKGRVTMVDFDFGVIHFQDDVKKSFYGHDYKDLELIV